MNLAIIGATGNVGRKIIEVLEKSRLKIDNLYLVASRKSAGKKLKFNKRNLTIEQLEKYDFSKAEITNSDLTMANLYKAILKNTNLNNSILKKGEETIKAFQGLIEKQPASCNGLLSALDTLLCPATEMVFVGSKKDSIFQEMYRKAQHDYIPNKILVYSEGDKTDIEIPMTKGKRTENNNAAVFLCQNETCHSPVHSGKALENILEKPPMIKVNIFDEEKSEKEMKTKQNANFLGAMGQIFKHMGVDKK